MKKIASEAISVKKISLIITDIDQFTRNDKTIY